jgi:hypothetical protein
VPIPSKHLGASVTRLLYSAVMTAYGLSILHFATAGILVYVAFLVVTKKLGLLADFKRWPVISKVAVYVSPFLILLGVYFSFSPFVYGELTPLAAYGFIAVVGGLALGTKIGNVADDTSAK